jgi:AraC family transcriptional regulator
MGKVAAELQQALKQRVERSLPGQATARVLARGAGWTVSDVVCTSGPRDRPFEERHAGYSIAVVVAGSFQYRSTTGQDLMTPGSLLLGNPGQCFECGHEHGAGDRCLSFYYAPDHFETLAADTGIRASQLDFRILRVPATRELSPLAARACAGLTTGDDWAERSWEELSIQLATRAVWLAGNLSADACPAPPSAVARVTRVLRSIEQGLDASLTLGTLAGEAGLSRYHFLRTFERLTGLTPHQYLLRSRLREAATRLAVEPVKITDIALDCGFGDVSNFNRAFRAEFGVSPRGYRSRANQRPKCSRSIVY